MSTRRLILAWLLLAVAPAFAQGTSPPPTAVPPLVSTPPLVAAPPLVSTPPPFQPQPQDDRQKSFTMVRVARPPVLDGRLDDEAWTQVTADRSFRQNFPEAGKPPTEETELRVVYDDRALYVGVRCHDRHPERMTEWLTRRDRDTNADKITIDIDSRNDHLSAYHFSVNVSGVLVDGVRFNDTEYTGDWDGLWRAATHKNAEGWSVEVEIPWRTLRFSPGTSTMGFQVRRHLPRHQETDAWAYIPRGVSGEVSRYGHLEFAGDLGPARLIQVAPYVAARFAMRGGEPDAERVDISPNVGVDFKLGLTSNLTLDATLNPDFGQVEADQAQLNLTTFELFFPEKRPFFLEGVELYATPIQQFYTRRIGLNPRRPRLLDGEELLETPALGRIWSAAKLTGRVSRHLSVAVLDAVTARREAVVRRADGSLDEHRLADPLTNFAVLRLRSGFGNSYVGLTGTAVNRFETPTDRAICSPDKRCTSDAYTVGADARLATRDGTWGATVHGVVSHLEHGPERVRPDGTVVRPGDTGWGLQVSAGKNGGERILFGFDYTAASPTLDLSDAGFLRQANLHRIEASMDVRSVKPRGRTLEGYWSLFSSADFAWDGTRLRTNVGNWGWMRLRSFWQFATGFGYNLRYRDNRETRDGALTERAGIAWWGVSVRSDPRRRFVFHYGGEAGVKGSNQPYVNGRLTLMLHPVPPFELDLSPGFNYGAGDPRWYATDEVSDGLRRYRFGLLESASIDVTLRGTYTFTPRLTLQAYAQLYLASGHYAAFRSVTGEGPRPFLPLAALKNERCAIATAEDRPCDPSAIPDFRDGAINATVVLRWEYRPGSTLIAVYSHSQSQRPFLPAVEGRGRLDLNFFRNSPALDVFQIKLSYLWG